MLTLLKQSQSIPHIPAIEVGELLHNPQSNRFKVYVDKDGEFTLSVLFDRPVDIFGFCTHWLYIVPAGHDSIRVNCSTLYTMLDQLSLRGESIEFIVL